MSIAKDDTERRVLAAVIMPQKPKQKAVTRDLDPDSPLKKHINENK